jgi:hypothetical protein
MTNDIMQVQLEARARDGVPRVANRKKNGTRERATRTGAGVTRCASPPTSCDQKICGVERGGEVPWCDGPLPSAA